MAQPFNFSRNMKLWAFMFFVALGLGNLSAQTRNDLLLMQDLENPNLSAFMSPGLEMKSAWRDKGVLQLRVQQEGDEPGSFRKMVDLNENGNPLRKESQTGETWIFGYGKDGSVRRVDEFKQDELVATTFFYYERNGDIRKSVKTWVADNREVEGYYDKSAHLIRVRHLSKGIVTKTLNIQSIWNSEGQLTAMRTPDLNATYFYNGKNLVQCRMQEVGKTTQININYGDHGIAEIKKYEERDGDLILQETNTYEYNSAGLLARHALKPRDPQSPLVVKNYFYDAFAPQSMAMRGDDWDGGGYGYGTPVLMSWSNPDLDTRVTDSLYTLRIDMKPGVGQSMPNIKNMNLRLNNELTQKEIGKVVLRKEGAGAKYYIEEHLTLAEGPNAIRLDVETDLGKFSSGERYITYKNPNSPVKVDKLHVLAIGVSDYALDDLDLNTASEEVQKLVTTLTAQQGQLFSEVRTKVILDSEATKTNIEEALRSMKGKISKDDLVLVYFAGHGEELDGNFYLKPHDVKGTGAELSATAIDNRWVMEELSRHHSNTLYFLDASHPVAGTQVEAGSANMDEVIQDFEDVTTTDDNIRIFMSATSAKQQAKAQGIFVTALLEGLQGKADEAGNNNQVVTVEELGDYVTDRVLGMTSWKQKPVQVKHGIGMVPIAKIVK
jgi:hypothetical protein